MMNAKILVASALAFAAMVAGCEKAEDAASKAANKTADAAKAAGDTAKKAADATKDAAAKTADAAKAAAASATADVTKWLTDTVEKQWPEAKKALDAITPKIAELKDAATKTKAEGVLKDLKDQIKPIEDAVAKLKGASGADVSKMLTEVKGKFDGWMTKLGELKTMVGMK